jgi:hypothetical protein
VIADIYRQRVETRGYGPELWGWKIAYGKPSAAARSRPPATAAARQPGPGDRRTTRGGCRHEATRLIMLVPLALLAGCLEVDQHPHWVKGQYAGKKDDRHFQTHFHNDRLSWWGTISQPQPAPERIQPGQSLRSRPCDQLNALRALLRCTSCLLLSLSSAWAGVPNKDAKPAYAEEQTILQAEQGANRPSRPGLADSGRVHIDRHYLGQYGATEGTSSSSAAATPGALLRNGPIATHPAASCCWRCWLIFCLSPRVGRGRRRNRDGASTASPLGAHGALGHGHQLHRCWPITGLIIMFGKKHADAVDGARRVRLHRLSSSNTCTTFVGPLFVVCSVLMFFTFLHRNFFKPHRLAMWLKAGGMLISHKHVPAGFFNAGEKAGSGSASCCWAW